MFTPIDFKELGKFVSSVLDYNTERKINAEEERKRIDAKKKQEKELRKWQREKANEEFYINDSRRHPDNWTILPEGWSPFGLFL